MSPSERFQTLRNVISDLEVTLVDAALENGEDTLTEDQWKDAQLACEYVTEEQPHL